VFDVSRSALMVGVVGVVQFGPQLLFSLISGKRADLGNPLRQIMFGRLVCVVGSGFIAALMLLIPGASPRAVTGVVVAGSLVVGFGFVVGGPAMQSIVPSLIRPGELSTAMALNSVPMTIGRMLGPVLGSLIASQLGPGWAFGVSAGLNLAFVAMLAAVRFPAPPTRKPDSDYRVRAALRFVWNDRALGLALLAVAVIGFASDPSITLAPPMAAEIGGDNHLVGRLTAAFGLGAALALGMLASSRRRMGSTHAASVGLSLLGIGSAICAAAMAPWAALVGFAVAGSGFGTAMTGLSTVVQERAPEELRGRIMALWMVGFVGSRPLAATVLGGSADLWSVRVSFAISAALVIATAVWCRPRRLTGAWNR
jgi:MFS family permease